MAGKCIIAGTDQGIYGSTESAENGFHITQILPDGSKSTVHSYPYSPEALRKIAESAVFDSYAAGTACTILEQYPDLGLRLEVSKRDLPLKKGLSSSAATCVLVARAFNLVHGLNLSIEEEMEVAYKGELLTGSLCGRMDQACAYGRNPVLLTFDGDEMTAEPLSNREPLYFLMVDLQAKKNTRRILEDLNASFSAGNGLIRKALGEENHRITAEACMAIERGDPEQLGKLMTEAQRVFDEMISPECPSELTAPILHEMLRNKAAGDLAWGGKGVGSQGDGAAQFICKGNSERRLLKDKLVRDHGVLCHDLTL